MFLRPFSSRRVAKTFLYQIFPSISPELVVVDREIGGKRAALCIDEEEGKKESVEFKLNFPSSRNWFDFYCRQLWKFVVNREIELWRTFHLRPGVSLNICMVRWAKQVVCVERRKMPTGKLLIFTQFFFFLLPDDSMVRARRVRTLTKESEGEKSGFKWSLYFNATTITLAVSLIYIGLAARLYLFFSSTVRARPIRAAPFEIIKWETTEKLSRAKLRSL